MTETSTPTTEYLPCPGETCRHHGRKHWHMKARPLPTPTVAIVDEHSVLLVTVDYHDGRGPQLSLSVPSGRLAAYQEARDRQHAEAFEKVTQHAATLRTRFAR